MPKESKIDNKTFVEAYLEAKENGKGLQGVADKLGVSKNYVSVKAIGLRGQGVNLPTMYKTTPDKIDELNVQLDDSNKRQHKSICSFKADDAPCDCPAELDDSKNTGKHTHTPIPEYKEALTTAGHKIKFVNEVISGLETSDLLKNCPACVASSVVQPPNTGNTLDEIISQPDSIELVEYELSEALKEQGVRPNVYPKLSDSAKSKLTKYIEQQVLIGRIDELKMMDEQATHFYADNNYSNHPFILIEQHAIKNRQTTLKAQLKEKE